ncbi:hypothetical protein [Cryobacterium sp. M15]|uniref:hypothetical protein n=1 Tax=Cryobacterium sp. M15 TaxID=2048291 RepID=UPI000CE4CAB7|nr:hypothetical protein [Cryobacterium sp. M15]
MTKTSKHYEESNAVNLLRRFRLEPKSLFSDIAPLVRDRQESVVSVMSDLPRLVEDPMAHLLSLVDEGASAIRRGIDEAPLTRKQRAEQKEFERRLAVEVLAEVTVLKETFMSLQRLVLDVATKEGGPLSGVDAAAIAGITEGTVRNYKKKPQRQNENFFEWRRHSESSN